STRVVLPAPECPTSTTLRTLPGCSTTGAGPVTPFSWPFCAIEAHLPRAVSSWPPCRCPRRSPITDLLRSHTRPPPGTSPTASRRAGGGTAGRADYRESAMAKIFSGAVRVSGARVVDPIGRALLRLGISPDLVTVLGTLGVVAGAVAFGAGGKFLGAALGVAVFAVVDFVDGAMARARGYSTRFGAFLDSTVDRIADGAVLGAVAYWYAGVGETPTLVVTLVCLVASQVISYVKARAQSLGIDCDVGIAERRSEEHT